MPDRVHPSSPPRVLIVDADPRVRESLAGLLRIGRRCLVVGSAGSASAALELAAGLGPDVVVIDPRLPGEDCAALIASLRDLAPEIRVLILDWPGRPAPAVGADGHVRKTFRPHELIGAVLETAGRAPS